MAVRFVSSGKRCKKSWAISISWRVIDAAHFVPQHRERILIAGFRENCDFAMRDVKLPESAPTLRAVLHPEDGSEPPEDPYTLAPRGRVNPKYTLTNKLWAYLQAYAAKHRAAGNGFGFGLVDGDSIARTLSARYYKDGSEILVSRGRGRKSAPPHAAGVRPPDGFPGHLHDSRIRYPGLQAVRQQRRRARDRNRSARDAALDSRFARSRRTPPSRNGGETSVPAGTTSDFVMTDVHTREQRSRNMAAIRSRNTKPEVRVRRVLHAMGFRFRLHRKDLPGRPDIVLPKFRTAIFVHGCFWHCHRCKYGSVVPATRAEFWAAKRGGNVARDRRHAAALRRLGWRVVLLWECEVRTDEVAEAKVRGLRLAR